MVDKKLFLPKDDADVIFLDGPGIEHMPLHLRSTYYAKCKEPCPLCEILGRARVVEWSVSK